ncbi:hypothetical protein [Halobaculum sp. D14]|uniref:hypothetical protein n=1 Tax=unclassified Halobaculum TaxID=2640896 RepID=UPI003EC01A91
MDLRRKLSLSGLVAASAAYVFTAVAFTGSLHFGRLAAFTAVFLVVFLGFERFVGWAETLE